MNSPEKSAASLVASALVRNGYSTYKDAPVDGHLRAELSERMRFADEEVRLDLLPASALAAGTQA